MAVGAEPGASGAIHAASAFWNGQAWVESNPPGAELDAVSCSSRSRCYAVGLSTHHDGCPAPVLIDRWRAGRWSTEYRIDLAACGTYQWEYGSLSDISCPAAGSCVAVGSECCGDFGSYPLVASWNAHRARAYLLSAGLQGPGYPGEGYALSGVACTSARACTAVGYGLALGPLPPIANVGGPPVQTFVEHWNGRRWSVVATPNVFGLVGQLDAVACPSARACIAVGNWRLGTTLPLAESSG
jgi:hypothetical protein